MKFLLRYIHGHVLIQNLFWSDEKDSRISEIFFNTRREIMYPEWPPNVLFIVYTPMKYHDFTLIFLAAKGTIYNVTIATAIFSRLQITCYFHV